MAAATCPDLDSAIAAAVPGAPPAKVTYLVLPGVDHMVATAFSTGAAAYPAEFWERAFARFA